MEQWFHEAIYSTEINAITATFRLLMSFMIGGMVGMERRWRLQPAGLRTHMLISVGATLLTILSIYIPQAYGQGDPGRIAAQTITGIGFLGAGAIIKIGSNIRGLTTAASIWLIAAIGMGVGAGLYVVSGIASLLMLIALIVFERFEKRLVPDFSTKVLTVVTERRTITSDSILSILKSFNIAVVNVDIHHDMANNKTEMKFMMTFNGNHPVDSIIERIGEIETVLDVDLS